MCISYAHPSLILGSWRRLASKLLRCLDADRGERERDWLNEKISYGLIFKFLREEENETGVSFPPRFSFASDEGPVPANELESRALKSPIPP